MCFEVQSWEGLDIQQFEDRVAYVLISFLMTK